MLAFARAYCSGHTGVFPLEQNHVKKKLACQIGFASGRTNQKSLLIFYSRTDVKSNTVGQKRAGERNVTSSENVLTAAFTPTRTFSTLLAIRCTTWCLMLGKRKRIPPLITAAESTALTIYSNATSMSNLFNTISKRTAGSLLLSLCLVLTFISR